LIFSAKIFAAGSKPQTQADTVRHTFIQRTKSYKQLDLIDIVKIVLKKKLMPGSDSMGRHEKVHLSLLGAPGYTQSTGFIGIISGNIALYVKDKRNLNQSSIAAEFSYDQYNQSLLSITPNIWTKDDKWDLIGQNEFLKYPQATFGLGGHTLPSAAYNIDYFLVRAHETVLRHVIADFYIGLGYDFDYHFHIRELTDSINTDYKKYGGGSTSVTSGPKAEIEWDSRRNSLNPQGGFYATVIYGYYPVFWGSTYNYSSLKCDFRTYISLNKNHRHLLALWNYDWFTFNNHAPYLDLPATGWDDIGSTGRGYVQSRYRGKNFLYLEAEYRFIILRDGFLGGVVFANIESVTDYPSDRFTTVAPAWGAGLRVKLNKNSGSNICFDYGIGLHHSQGLTVNIGEVF
jgi:outer membrane protein assembly factor BamA